MSAVKEFLVPDLGEGLEDATITGWDVAVGDDVELNQTLCTVETNKAEVEIPSPYAGRIVELGGAEGETLTVGSVLVRIATVCGRARTRRPAAELQWHSAQAGFGGLRGRRRYGREQAGIGRGAPAGQAAGAKAGRRVERRSFPGDGFRCLTA